jgi:hypothetical protein
MLIKNIVKRYKFYLLLSALCALSSFFYTQPGYVCTNYAIQSLVPVGTIMVGGCLGDLVEISFLPTLLSGIAGCMLVKARMEFSNNNNIVIITKVLQMMIPVCWTGYCVKKKKDPKWCALLATWMEVGIQTCC